MGIGDALMASGEARDLYRRSKLPVIILGRDGRPLWSPVWNGIPYIIPRQGGRPCNRMINGPGLRPYIKAKSVDRWAWNRYTPKVAEIRFTAAEKAFAEHYRGAVMLEPAVKPIGHRNKAWLDIYWSQLASLLRKLPLVQCGPAGTHFLPGVTAVLTPEFRLACAVLAVCRAFVGTEGGLMHAAAAVDTPGVIIYGGFISPEVTGYALHRSLFTGNGLGCGMRRDCPHCAAAMTRITPAMVAEQLKGILDGQAMQRGDVPQSDVRPGAIGQPESHC